MEKSLFKLVKSNFSDFEFQTQSQLHFEFHYLLIFKRASIVMDMCTTYKGLLTYIAVQNENSAKILIDSIPYSEAGLGGST